MMRLEPRAPEAFRDDPYGGYLAGRWMYFALAPELFGYALWDAPDAEDLASEYSFEYSFEYERSRGGCGSPGLRAHLSARVRGRR